MSVAERWWRYTSDDVASTMAMYFVGVLVDVMLVDVVDEIAREYKRVHIHPQY